MRMKTAKMFWRDMRIGTFRHVLRFLIIPVVVILMTSGFAEYAGQLYEEGTTCGLGTAADYYLYIMQGMYIYKFSADSEFVIPISWFVLNIGLSYMIAYYPYKDYSEFGTTVFTAGASRTKWWLAKILWCIASVALYYVVIILTCGVVAYANGAKISTAFSIDILEHIYGDVMQYVSGKDFVLISLVLPFTISVMLTELQMLLSFVLSPVVSFAAACGLYIVSAYYTCWWLPGNYTMWIRSAYVNYEGIRPDSGFILAAFVLVSTLICGTAYFRGKDVL